MKIYNAMTSKKEEFIPLKGNNVKMYACGITVYDLCHIGHARQAIVYEMMANYLKFRGYDVKYVRNYTDIDDKIINRANKVGKDALEFSREQILETEIDMKGLHVTDADIKPKASEYIDKIINFISKLIDKGYAYATEKGDVYYEVKKFEEYGKLSHRNVDELLNGVRIDLEEGKKNPIDFALWKSAKQGEISWKSPWGNGRPGWHIECSVMALDTLGETIDIHGGGRDLLFPHHENEIAQSEAVTGKNFAKYWTHCGLIKINGEKMSKSLGNSLTIREALKEYNYETIKYVMLSRHYASDMDILDSDYQIAETHLYYFYKTLERMQKFITEYNGDDKGDTFETNDSKEIVPKFIEVMDEDFNTSGAIANLYNLFKYANAIMNDAKKSNRQVTANTVATMMNDIHKVYSVLGLLEQKPEKFIAELKEKYLKKLQINPKDIKDLISERMNAKKIRDYEKADSIRSQLESQGVILNDTRTGTEWDIKALYKVF